MREPQLKKIIIVVIKDVCRVKESQKGKQKPNIKKTHQRNRINLQTRKDTKKEIARKKDGLLRKVQTPKETVMWSSEIMYHGTIIRERWRDREGHSCTSFHEDHDSRRGFSISSFVFNRTHLHTGNK